MKKLLITGKNGFIAKNLTEKLKDKYEITAVGRKEVDLLNAEKLKKLFQKNKFDVVIHTATYDAVAKGSTKDPKMVLENNLKMFFNLVRCKKYFGKMIYFGSGAEFSREHWKPRMKEDYFDSYVPEDQYGFSKYLMTKYCLDNINIFNLRLFGVFGKYDDYQTRLIPNLCYLAAKNLPLTIEQNKFYDFLYVDDLVKIVDWFIQNKPKEKVYNVCTGKTVDFVTIANKIIKISGKKLKIKIKKKGLGQEYSGNNSRLKKEIKCLKFTPIDVAIKKIYDHQTSN